MVLETIDQAKINVGTISTEVVPGSGDKEKYFDPDIWQEIKEHFRREGNFTPKDLLCASEVAVAFPNRLKEFNLTEDDADSSIVTLENFRKESDWREYVYQALAFKLAFPQFFNKVGLHERPNIAMRILGTGTPWENLLKYYQKRPAEDMLYYLAMLDPSRRGELPLERVWSEQKDIYISHMQRFDLERDIIVCVKEVARLRLTFPNHYSDIKPTEEQLTKLEEARVVLLDRIKKRKSYIGSTGERTGLRSGGIDYIVCVRDLMAITADRVTVDDMGIHLTFKNSPDETHIQPEERSF